MKNLKTIAIAFLLTFSATISAQNKKIDAKTSTISWVGKKVTGQHSGTIGIKDGTLVFKKNKLKGGTITVDMASILVTDLQTGKGKEDLEGHLKADDFFGTAKFATAKIDFKLIADNGDGKYTVTADLTIKDVTKPVKFDIVVKGKTATTTLKIDRTKYGIKYGSGSFFENLGDKTISDEFELNVTLKF
jgi:polyisoprenoid-binding protein YceI